MKLPVMPPVQPMLAKLIREIPRGEGYLYEPKWDGFRALVFRDGRDIQIMSRNERSLNRYFPELLPAFSKSLPRRSVTDGEIVVAGPRGLDFDALLQRIHPAESRVEHLARETPAAFVAFDLLALENKDLRHLPLSERRAKLERALRDARPPVHLSPATRDRSLAKHWFEHFEGAGFDGILVKPLELPYVSGKREMFKLKHERTADCVVGGFRYHKDGRSVGSLLLGLYDKHGTLHHVGVAAGLRLEQRKQLSEEIEPLRHRAEADHPWLDLDESEREHQRVPGGPSRWSGQRATDWEPVRPELVVEVAYDHLQGDRFRHVTRFIRLRPDRNPRSCRYSQLEEAPPADLQSVFELSAMYG